MSIIKQKAVKPAFFSVRKYWCGFR